MADDKKEFGEGNYKASQNFREAQEEFAEDKTKVKNKAREAADALDGSEAAELAEAREKASKGETAS